MPAHLIDISNQHFGEWEALEYVGKGFWKCRCSCGKIKNVRASSLKSGTSVSCGHNANKNKVIDLKGKHFGELEVIEYEGNRYWKCKCSCRKVVSVQGKYLRDGTKTSCGECTKPIQPNDIFGEWKVIKRTKLGYYECKCSCGTIKEVCGSRLLDGSSRSCGKAKHDKRIIDLKDKHFGRLKVIEYAGDSYWKCECSCGNIENKHSNGLRNGESTMCTECYKKYNIDNRLTDIKGKYFGELEVLEYAGYKKWLCKCSCGKHTIVLGCNLRNGSTRSCGHLLVEHAQSYSKINRNEEQLYAVQSSDNLRRFIYTKFKEKPTSKELAKELGLTLGATNRIIKELGVESSIRRMTNSSFEEDELYNEICKIYSKDVIRHYNKILGRQEVDIYVPDKNIAIEFNGTYWHSTLFKDSIYHQQKTISCAQKGIHLIHIFEYEWKDKNLRNKILLYLDRLLNIQSLEKIYARNVEVTKISSEEAYKFEELYHLQGKAPSEINIGLKYNNEIVGVMTFGKPRFNADVQYELIRLCYDSRYTVIGGSEKMFKYFLDNYNPESIISYCDISKFTGNVYTKLGFKTSKDVVTKPNYKWISIYTDEVFSRYQTQKHKLLEKGLGTPDQTEDEIMEDLGFLKIYDAGNLKLLWERS